VIALVHQKEYCKAEYAAFDGCFGAVEAGGKTEEECMPLVRGGAGGWGCGGGWGGERRVMALFSLWQLQPSLTCVCNHNQPPSSPTV